MGADLADCSQYACAREADHDSHHLQAPQQRPATINSNTSQASVHDSLHSMELKGKGKGKDKDKLQHTGSSSDGKLWTQPSMADTAYEGDLGWVPAAL